MRHRTGAAPGAWQRAVDTMAEAREVEGLDVLADTTPFRDGLGQMAGILPQWVLADGWEEARSACATRQRASGCAATATATGASSTRATGSACACRRASSTRGLEGIPFDQAAAQMGLDPWDAYFEILAAAGPAIESLLLVGELFTDEHLAEMISHPLFCLGVDGYTASLDPALEAVAGHPVCFAGHVHYLTHHVGEVGTLPLEEAIRKMTCMPAQHFRLADRGELRPGMAADLVVLDLDRLADGSTLERPLAYVEGVDEVLVNGTAVVEAGEHTGARPGRHLALGVGSTEPPMTSTCAPTSARRRPRRCGRRCARRGSAGRARGEDENVDGLERRGRGAARQGGGASSSRRARWRTSSPCSRWRPAAGGRVESAAHILVNEGDWSRTAETRAVPSRPAAARPGRGRGVVAGRSSASRTRTRARGGTVLNAERTAELAARRARRAHLDGARLANAAVALGVPLASSGRAVRHGRPQPEQGPVRAVRRAARRRRARRSLPPACT